MNGLPGIGGSLGACAFCGKPFMAEILMGRSVPTFSIDQVQGPLAAHRACIDKYEHFTSISDWPDESPVKKLLLAHNARIDAETPNQKEQESI